MDEYKYQRFLAVLLLLSVLSVFYWIDKINIVATKIAAVSHGSTLATGNNSASDSDLVKSVTAPATSGATTDTKVACLGRNNGDACSYSKYVCLYSNPSVCGERVVAGRCDDGVCVAPEDTNCGFPVLPQNCFYSTVDVSQCSANIKCQTK